VRSSGFAGSVLLLALLLVAATPPAAEAASRSKTGGTAFDSDVPKPASRPVASQLRVSPRRIVADDPPPQLRFRVRQRGVPVVAARVVVLRAPHNAVVARIDAGLVRTGKLVTAQWPSDVRVRAGRYLVRLHVKDPRGRVLRRSARTPGRTRIVVRGRKKPAPGMTASATLPAPARSPGGRGVFPVAGAYAFAGAGGRFGTARPGHVHEGQDIAADAGTPVVAPYEGRVSTTGYQASAAGEYVVLDAIDSRDYFFAHCVRRSTTVPEGTIVAAGAPLCEVGETGAATGPHLHFEIWNVGWRVDGGLPIDPLPELLAWAAR
jgi:murein DD-endopeptidase MepM/ murein hydrolase activator NlpD